MDAYIGEVRAFGFQFAPEGWLECNGQTYSIQQFTPLFAVINTTYGGDGKTTFGVPNLQGNAVVGVGQGPGLSSWTQGHTNGSEGIALTMQSQLPSHNHTITMEMVTANYQANTLATPVANSSWLSRPLQVTGAGTPANTIFNFTAPATGVSANTALFPLTLSATAGGSQAHENRQPYLPMIYCICWNGVYPMPAN